MSSLVKWKIFLNQLGNKTNTDYIVYGEFIPSFMFMVPESIQNNTKLKNEYARIAIPGSDRAFLNLIESIPSVLDSDYIDDSRGRTQIELKNTLSYKKVLISSEESDNEFSLDSERTDLKWFSKNISFSIEINGRYNKEQITLIIEKWKLQSIDDILDCLYTQAPHSGFIPLVHSKSGFKIPDKFSERHKLSLESKLILLKDKQIPKFGGVNVTKWMTV